MAVSELVDDSFYKTQDLVRDLNKLDLKKMSFPKVVGAAVNILADVRFLKERTVFGNDANFASAVTTATKTRECGVPDASAAFHTYAAEQLESSRLADVARIEAEHARIDEEYASYPELIEWLKH